MPPQMNGTACGLFTQQCAHGDNTTSLGHLQESRTISVDCTLLNYSLIFTTDTQLATFILFLSFLTLGRPLCQYCSSWYIVLLAAFAGAGVALVIPLISCNITVADEQ